LGGSCDEEERVPKKTLKGYIEVRRRDGTPTRKWLDEMDRSAKRRRNAVHGEGRQKLETPGSWGLKRPG
jgi:hypothetical protein